MPITPMNGFKALIWFVVAMVGTIAFHNSILNSIITFFTGIDLLLWQSMFLILEITITIVVPILIATGLEIK